MQMTKLILVFALAVGGCGGSSPPTGGGGGTSGGGGGGSKNWLAGGSGTLASTGDGVHYALSPSHVTDANLWSLYCVGRNVGWAAGDRGTLLTTVDGGQSWTTRATGVSVPLRA